MKVWKVYTLTICVLFLLGMNVSYGKDIGELDTGGCTNPMISGSFYLCGQNHG